MKTVYMLDEYANLTKRADQTGGLDLACALVDGLPRVGLGPF